MPDKWSWELELKKAHLAQQDVGQVIGLTKSQMSQLVKKMIPGKGLTASELDKKRWKDALDLVELKQAQLKEGKANE